MMAIRDYFVEMGKWIVDICKMLSRDIRLQAVLIAYLAVVGLIVGIIMELVRH